MGFPDGSAGKESAAVRETGVRSLGGEDPLGEGMATHSNIIVWKIPMDRAACWSTIHEVAKSWTQWSNWAHTYS